MVIFHVTVFELKVFGEIITMTTVLHLLSPHQVPDTLLSSFAFIDLFNGLFELQIGHQKIPNISLATNRLKKAEFKALTCHPIAHIFLKKYTV